MGGSIIILKNPRVFTSYRPRFVYIFPSLLSHQLVQKSPHLQELYIPKTSHLLPPWVADLVLHQDSMEPTVHILFVLHAPSGPYTGGRVRKPSSTIKVGFYLKHLLIKLNIDVKTSLVFTEMSMNPAFVLCLVHLTSHDQWYVLQRFIDRHLN